MFLIKFDTIKMEGKECGGNVQFFLELLNIFNWNKLNSPLFSCELNLLKAFIHLIII